MKRRTSAEVATVAFAAAVAGIAMFSLMDAVMKGLVLTLGAYTTLLWRSLASTVLAAALYFGRPRVPMTAAAMRVHAMRGAVSAALSMSFFWGLARMPMAQAVALTFVSPLLSLYLSAALLNERVGRTAVIASAIAFAGVAVILVGQWRAAADLAAVQGALAVLVSALFYAFNIVLMRRQALVAVPLEVAFSQSVVVSTLLVLGSPFFAGVPEPSHIGPIVVAALLAVAGLTLLAWAYARDDASRLSTSEYTSLVWAAALGWAFFGERVTATTLAGAGLIVVGCVLATRGRRAGADAATDGADTTGIPVVGRPTVEQRSSP